MNPETPDPVATVETFDLVTQTLAAVRKTSRSSNRRYGQRIATEPRFSGAAADFRDPQLLGAGVAELIDLRGWESRAKAAAVIGSWREIAGEQLADHLDPVSYQPESGLLILQADATAWATQTRLMIPALLDRIDTQLGCGIVRQIEVRSPAAPRRRPGRLRVPGRGPRDTYG